MPGVTSIGGYSGHGVMLSNYCGKLYSDMVTGNRSDLDLFRELNVPAFSRRHAVPLRAFVRRTQLVVPCATSFKSRT